MSSISLVHPSRPSLHIYALGTGDDDDTHQGTNFFFPFLITFTCLLLVFVSCGVRARRRLLLRQRGLLQDPTDADWDWPPRHMWGPTGDLEKPKLWECRLEITPEKERGASPRWESLMPLSVSQTRESADPRVGMNSSGSDRTSSSPMASRGSAPVHIPVDTSSTQPPIPAGAHITQAWATTSLHRFVPSPRILGMPLRTPTSVPLASSRLISPPGPAHIRSSGNTDIRTSTRTILLEKIPEPPIEDERISLSEDTSLHIAVLIAMPSPDFSTTDHDEPSTIDRREIHFGVTTVPSPSNPLGSNTSGNVIDN